MEASAIEIEAADATFQLLQQAAYAYQASAALLEQAAAAAVESRPKPKKCQSWRRC